MREYRRKRDSTEDAEKTVVLRRVVERHEDMGLECPDCKNTREFFIDFENAQVVCKICGLVLVSGFRFTTLFPNNPFLTKRR